MKTIRVDYFANYNGCHVEGDTGSPSALEDAITNRMFEDCDEEGALRLGDESAQDAITASVRNYYSDDSINVVVDIDRSST